MQFLPALLLENFKFQSSQVTIALYRSKFNLVARQPLHQPQTCSILFSRDYPSVLPTYSFIFPFFSAYLAPTLRFLPFYVHGSPLLFLHFLEKRNFNDLPQSAPLHSGKHSRDQSIDDIDCRDAKPHHRRVSRRIWKIRDLFFWRHRLPHRLYHFKKVQSL